MMPVHRIGSLRLDVTLAGTTGAGLERGRALQQHLMAFCARALDAGLTPVLDHARPAVIRTLELDLGELPLARFEIEFADRLRHALSAQLWRLGLLSGSHAQEVPPSAPADALASLRAMLAGQGGPAAHLEALLYTLARREHAALTALLQQALRDEHPRRRLLRALTPAGRVRLWHWVGAPQPVLRLLAALRTALAGGTRASAMTDLQLHEAALGHWLAQRSAFDLDVLVHGTVRTLAQAFQRPYGSMVQALAIGAAPTGALPAILARLQQAVTGDGATGSWRAPVARFMHPVRPTWIDASPGHASERMQLLHWLATGQLRGWRADRCDPAIMLARQLARDAPGLAAALAHLPDAASAATRLVRHVPRAGLAALARALRPEPGGQAIGGTNAGALLAALSAPVGAPAGDFDVPPAPAERALTRLLRHGTVLNAAEMTALQDAVRSLAAMSAASTTRRRWRRLLVDAAGAPLERARLSSLPPALLMRLVPLLLPAPQAGEVGVLLAALAQTLPSGQRSRAARVVWDTWFEQWHRQRAQRWSSAQFLVALAQRLRSQFGLQTARLLQSWLAAMPAHGNAHAGQARRSLALAAHDLATPRLAPDDMRNPVERSLPQAPTAPGTRVAVGNAGLVLLHPFLALYFDRVGLLNDGDFIDDQARSRAVLLLQFLASGDLAPPDHALALNKFLCGMPFASVPVLVDPLDAEAMRLGVELLHMVTQRWERLRHTSVAGLRDTFLMRAGTLVAHEGKTTLHVPHHTVDILKQTLPWQYAVVKLPWTAHPLFVGWR